MPAETAEPYRIRLVVQRTNDAFEARWIEPEGQESESFPLSLPLGQRDKEDLRWYLEKYVGFVGTGDRVLAAELEQKINDWGRAGLVHPSALPGRTRPGPPCRAGLACHPAFSRIGTAGAACPTFRLRSLPWG